MPPAERHALYSRKCESRGLYLAGALAFGCHAHPDDLVLAEAGSWEAGAECVQGWRLSNEFLGPSFALQIRKIDVLNYVPYVGPDDAVYPERVLWQLDQAGELAELRSVAFPDRVLTTDLSFEGDATNKETLWRIDRVDSDDEPTYTFTPKGAPGSALATTFAPPYLPQLVPGMANPGHRWHLSALYYCERD